jgi:hypothetical protein
MEIGGRCAPTAAVTAVLVVLLAAWPAGALGGPRRGHDPAAIAPFRGLAAWIDIYDSGPWRRPARVVHSMARRGVATVFVQTSNHRRRRALHRPAKLARMLSAARRHEMQVIAWYLPGFDNPRRDWRRVKAAVTHETDAGHRFDGFALDIEATAVRNIAVRNRRMLRLSGRLRRLVGDEYPLGAITPDPVSQRYWPGFPYRQVRHHYDAILPMSYWTFGTRGPARVHRRTCRALRVIRARTGDRSAPIHVIGGIAGHASSAEVRGFARAALGCGAVGASLYDAPITSARQWRELTRIDRLRPAELG